MASVLNKTTLQYIESVNTPDYPTSDWIVNPDMSNVEGVPLKYWKLDGTDVVEMSQAEKEAVDAAGLQSRKDTANNYSVDTKIAITALVKVLNTRLSQNPITKAEMVQALKDEIQ